MDYCEFCKVGKYTEICNCNITNKICPLMRKCSTDMVWKPTKTYETCSIYQENAYKIPTGYFKVRFENKGYLYVEHKDGVVLRIKNPNENEIPKCVKIKKEKGEFCIVDCKF